MADALLYRLNVESTQSASIAAFQLDELLKGL
jgi:hypothetical protein